MATINLLSSPEHNYLPSELIAFLLGVSMTIQGIMLMIKKEKKWLIGFSFVTAAVSFYATLTESNQGLQGGLHGSQICQ